MVDLQGEAQEEEELDPQQQLPQIRALLMVSDLSSCVRQHMPFRSQVHRAPLG